MTLIRTGDDNIVDLRSSDRYIMTPQQPGSFGAIEVQIVDFSPTGLQVQHAEPVKLGVQARISFTSSATDRVSWRGTVVWSHLSKQPALSGKHPYLSGIRVDEEREVVGAILQRLVDFGAARVDKESIERKKRSVREKAKQRMARQSVKTFSSRVPEITSDQLLMIQGARERLQGHPDEAKKWYARAKFSMTDDHHSFVPAHYREDALAVWEYLERTIDLEKIVRVFEGSLK